MLSVKAMRECFLVGFIVLTSCSWTLAATAPQLAVGSFGGCDFRSYVDVTNHTHQRQQAVIWLNRGNNLGPTIPTLVNGQNLGNKFTTDIPAHGTRRFNFSPVPGASGITTNAVTILHQPANLGFQAAYTIDCSDGKKDSFSYPFSAEKRIPQGGCAAAPIHQDNTAALALVGNPPNKDLNVEIQSTVYDVDGNIENQTSFPYSGEHRANVLSEFNQGQAPVDGTWQICVNPTSTRARTYVAVVFHEINENGLLQTSDHEIRSNKDDCSSDQDTLCLGPAGRFKAEMDWQNTPSGPSQLAQAFPFDDYGFFFLDQDNGEMIVKVLDACDLAAFNNFWVFAGGLTDVEYTLTVTDTRTGEERKYGNELGNPAPPVLDTGAFDTCP